MVSLDERQIWSRLRDGHSTSEIAGEMGEGSLAHVEAIVARLLAGACEADRRDIAAAALSRRS